MLNTLFLIRGWSTIHNAVTVEFVLLFYIRTTISSSSVRLVNKITINEHLRHCGWLWLWCAIIRDWKGSEIIKGIEIKKNQCLCLVNVTFYQAFPHRIQTYPLQTLLLSIFCSCSWSNQSFLSLTSPVIPVSSDSPLPVTLYNTTHPSLANAASTAHALCTATATAVSK